MGSTKFLMPKTLHWIIDISENFFENLILKSLQIDTNWKVGQQKIQNIV